MAGLESLRTPDEVAELRGLSINQVLGLHADNGATETISADDEAAVDEAGAEAEEQPA